MGLCQYVDLCFHASSLPCLHTFWHAIPTSFYIFNVFYYVFMRTTLENGVLRNGQQPGRAENSFIDQGEFVAMKTLSSCKALRCDKCQFRD